MMQCWCTDDALMMPSWCTHDALMMRWWCNDDSLMMCWWCPDDALMMPWWCCDNAPMMHWWCTDDALMMHWWCTDDSLGMIWCTKIRFLTFIEGFMEVELMVTKRDRWRPTDWPTWWTWSNLPLEDWKAEFWNSQNEFAKWIHILYESSHCQYLENRYGFKMGSSLLKKTLLILCPRLVGWRGGQALFMWTFFWQNPKYSNLLNISLTKFPPHKFYQPVP